MDEDRLAKEARRQFGVFTRDMALTYGFSSSAIGRRVAAGEWEAVQRGVYRARGCPAIPKQDVLAAWFAAGRDAVVSHASAGRLWKLDGLEFETRKVELSVPRGRRVEVPGVEIHVARDLDRCSMILERFRVTTLARTLVDLSSRLSLKRLEIALDSATRRTFDVLPDIEDELARIGSQGRLGAGALRDLVARKRGRAPTDSWLETTALQRLRDEGFPEPATQFPVFGDEGVPFVHLDLAYPAQLIAIVPDGLRTHGNRIRFDLDASQRTLLAGLRWHVLPITTTTVKGDAWLAAVERLLPPGSVRRKMRQQPLW